MTQLQGASFVSCLSPPAGGLHTEMSPRQDRPCRDLCGCETQADKRSESQFRVAMQHGSIPVLTTQTGASEPRQPGVAARPHPGSAGPPPGWLSPRTSRQTLLIFCSED